MGTCQIFSGTQHATSPGTGAESILEQISAPEFTSTLPQNSLI